MSPKHLKNNKSDDQHAEKANEERVEEVGQAMEQEHVDHEDKVLPPVINEESPVQENDED